MLGLAVLSATVKSVIPHACRVETAFTVIKRENLSRRSREWWMSSRRWMKSARRWPNRNVIRYYFSLSDVVVVFLVGKGKGVGIFISYLCLSQQKWSKE